MEQRLRNGSKNPLEMSDEGARTEGIQLTGFVVALKKHFLTQKFLR